LANVEATNWLDVEAAAAYLGASEALIRKLVLEHRVRHYKVGKLIRFDPADLDAFVRDGRVEPGDLTRPSGDRPRGPGGRAS